MSAVEWLQQLWRRLSGAEARERELKMWSGFAASHERTRSYLAEIKQAEARRLAAPAAAGPGVAR